MTRLRAVHAADRMNTGNEPRRHDGQGREACFFELVERGHGVDERRERLEAEGPQDQGRGQLLHAVDEDEQRGGGNRRPEQRQLDLREDGELAPAQGARDGVEARGDAAEPRLDAVQARIDRKRST